MKMPSVQVNCVPGMGEVTELLPRMISAIPLYRVNVAIVTANEGKPRWVTSIPLKVPVTTPMTKTVSMARGRGHPCSKR